MANRRGRRWLGVSAMAGLAVVASVATGGGVRAAGSASGTVSAAGSAGAPGTAVAADRVPVCGTPAPDSVRCHAWQLLNPAQNWHGHHSAGAAVTPNDSTISGAPATTTGTPTGYAPADLRAAYGLTGTGASTETIAIVDAYDDPYAAADLATYRAQYGLPACTTSTGCFKKISQSGSTTSLPAANTGWAEEISLDLDMASAICPNCKLLLVEATTASYANLGTAVKKASGTSGVVAISNSYGGAEFYGETNYNTYYNHSSIAVTASTGDSGYGVQFPASSPYVVAVGGTTLNAAADPTTGATAYSESAWSGAGSGCSVYQTRPTWQGYVANIAGSCAKRAVGDVAAVADPATGVAVYDSYNEPGWMVFGGTSVSAPVVAGVFALAGKSTYYRVQAASVLYKKASATTLNDITSGSNGTCTAPLLCTAGTGWDGPTGLGTPIGTGAF